jgi:hypothetical protein
VGINAVIFSDVDKLSSRSKLDEKISYVFISCYNVDRGKHCVQIISTQFAKNVEDQSGVLVLFSYLFT